MIHKAAGRWSRRRWSGSATVAPNGSEFSVEQREVGTVTRDELWQHVAAGPATVA